MVLLCVFCGSKQGTEGKTHKFPLKDKEILQSWLQQMDLGSNFVPKKYSLLCSDHFEENSFQEGTNKKCLRIGSIPTLFGKYKSTCAYCHAIKGQDKNISFRKFPLHNPELLKKWVTAMQLKDFIPTEKSLLCDKHFDKKCFRSSGHNLVLKASAVPTLFTSTDSEEIFIEIQENISDLPDKIYDVNRNQLITRQQNTKRILSECSTSSKIQKTDRPFTSTAMYSERETIMDYSLMEQCNKNVAPSINAAVEKVNGLICSKTQKTLRNIKEETNYIKHDHQYEASVETLRIRSLQQQKKIQVLMKQKRVQNQHISRLKKRITSLKDIVSELRKTRAIPDSGMNA